MSLNQSEDLSSSEEVAHSREDCTKSKANLDNPKIIRKKENIIIGRKSLIPLPTKSPEVVQQKRTPLASIQTIANILENEMVGKRRKEPSSPQKSSNLKHHSHSSLKNESHSSKISNSSVAKPKKPRKVLKSAECQTEDPAIPTVSTEDGASMVTGDIESLEYWKQLAEERRQALESALEENMQLHEKVEDLENELTITNELLNQAKTLAEMVQERINEEEESGFGSIVHETSTDE